jgi:hypothetical protein
MRDEGIDRPEETWSDRRPRQWAATDRLIGGAENPTRRTVVAWVLAGCAVAAGLSGCGSPRRTAAKKLLESISKVNRRYSIALKQFEDIVSARLNESPATTDEDVATGLEKLKATTAELVEESKGWTLPEGTETDSLMGVFRVVYTARQKLLDDFTPPFLEAIGNKVLPRSQKAQKAGKIFEAMITANTAQTVDLRRALRAYAGAMGVFSYE